ncbi:MAG: SDR family oxidoreductase [Myxococcota bacterium]
MSINSQSIIVFGATGGTGRHAVTQALADGHDVTAFVRTPSKLDLQHPRLTIVQGDVMDTDAVSEAIRGKDAVLCCIGAPPSSKAQIRARGTASIIAGMRRTGVTRLICQSSHGIAETAAELPWLMRWVIVPFYLKPVFADHEAQETVVRGSGLRWTLVRPPHLHDGARAAAIRHSPDFDPQTMTMKIARADVAGFMVRAAVEPAYVQQTVVVAAAA